MWYWRASKAPVKSSQTTGVAVVFAGAANRITGTGSCNWNRLTACGSDENGFHDVSCKRLICPFVYTDSWCRVKDTIKQIFVPQREEYGTLDYLINVQDVIIMQAWDFSKIDKCAGGNKAMLVGFFFKNDSKEIELARNFPKTNKRAGCNKTLQVGSFSKIIKFMLHIY